MAIGPMSEFKDNINPAHYKSNAGFECIDVIAEVTKGLSGMEAVETAQIIKYVWRWRQKNGLEDLRKAQWYLTDLIKRVENETTNSWYISNSGTGDFTVVNGAGSPRTTTGKG